MYPMFEEITTPPASAAPSSHATPVYRGVAEKVRRRPVLYPNHYCWFVLLSALDIMLTDTILNKFGKEFNPRELNTFADWVIRKFDLWGAIGLKCASIVVVIIIIEIVGRRRPVLGRTMVTCVVAMATVPVFAALVQLLAVAMHPH